MLLGLVMIVKNEAHGIAVTLESFKEHVDYWTILDTGSTDGTQDVIRKTLEGIPGELHEEPFVDFSTSRNQALALHGEKTAFTIMPDSDDRLHNGVLLRGFLTSAPFSADEKIKNAHAYLLNLKRGDLSYYLPIVLRTTSAWRYHGKVHEYVGPQHGEGYAEVKIPNVQLVQDHQPISAEASRKRWERDLQLLQDELHERFDDPRALFYLAQTYECLGKPREAIRIYERRVRVGGWHEETFEARLRRAKILQSLGSSWPEVQQAYLEAFESDPKRAEPLFKIAEHWYCANNHHMAYLFASRAAELPPTQATLFVDEDVYRWRAADIVAISGYYLDDPSAKRHGARCAEQCVRVNPTYERFRSNRAFYTPSATELFGFTHKPIQFKTEGEPWVPFNPSVHRTQNGCWRCIMRTSNYKILDGNYITPDNNIIHTRNFMLDLDDELNTCGVTEMIDKTGVPRSDYPCHGFEDCRLFEHEGQLVFTCTVCDFDLERAWEGPREIVLGVLDDDYAIVKATPLRGPWSNAAQKNWMPTGDGRLVYSANPNPHGKATVLDLKGDQVAWNDLMLGHHQLRGGSQMVRLDDGWLCVVHDVAWPGSRLYLHRFVFFDLDFKLVSMTDLFYFVHRGIEFCAGLALDGNRLVASFGVEDQRPYFGIFDLSVVRSRLKTDFQI